MHTGLPTGNRSRLGSAARSEFILLNAHRHSILACPHDYAFDNERKPDVIIQKHRPVDEGFDDLPWGKSFRGCKEQALAADIQALADNDPVQEESGFDTPALYCQPQLKTPVRSSIGVVRYGIREHYSQLL